MNLVIISDDAVFAEKCALRIVEEGFDCPSSSILPLNKAVLVLAKDKPDLIAAVLEPNPERSLGVIMTIKGQSPVHVLAIGPAVDTKLVLRVLRAGADDYVDSASMENELRDAMRRWKSKVTNATATGKIISLIAPERRMRSDHAAANLAVALAKRNSKYCSSTCTSTPTIWPCYST